MKNCRENLRVVSVRIYKKRAPLAGNLCGAGNSFYTMVIELS